MPGNKHVYIQKIIYGIAVILILSGILFSLPAVKSQANDAGYALDFDGVNDFVVLHQTLQIIGENWKNTKTISLWVKPNGHGLCQINVPGWCSNILGDKARWWGIVIGTLNGQDAIWLWNWDASPGSESDMIAIPYTPGEWVHVTMVHANGILKAYRNGELVGSVPSGPTQSPITGAQPVIHLGGIINTPERVWTFAGQLDEISIWDIELTQQQIQQNMYAILSGSEPNLRAYYRMSDGSGLILTDDSIYDWNGTLEDGGGIVPPNGAPPLWVNSTAFDIPPTPTPTNTSEPPTITPTPTNTTIPPSPTPTATGSIVPPTITPTPTLSNATVTPTFTSVPGSATPTLPPDIIEIGSYLSPGDAWDVVVVDPFAYIADTVAGLRILDISTPDSPLEVGSFDTPGSAYAVTIQGAYAYIADGRNGLHIVNISNPQNPTWVGGLDTPDLAWGVAVGNRFAFVADRWGGVRVINVNNPVQPIEFTSIATADQAMNVTINGSYLYIAAYEAGLLIYDIANPTTPLLRGSYNTPGNAFSVAVSNNIAYLADGPSGVIILDVNNPAQPALLGQIDTPGLARDIVFNNGNVYVADDSAGLRVLNVNNPSSPVEIGFVDTPGYARGVAYTYGFALVSDFNGGLRIIQSP